MAAVDASRATSPIAANAAPTLAAGTGWSVEGLRWLLGAGLAVLALCAAPYAVGAVFGPPHLERVGTFWFVGDFSQYQAAMLEGGFSDSWLVHDHLTAEPHSPVLMYPLYVALGKLAASLGLDAMALFTTLEWLGRIVLVGALYGFVGTFLPRPRERRLAFLLAVGTIGLAAWTVPLGLALDAAGIRSRDQIEPIPVNVFLEFNTLGTFFSAPHLMLGLALTLLAAPLYLQASQRGQARWLAALGGATATLSAIHPFNLPVLLSVLLADALLALRASGRARPLVAAVVATCAAAPLTLYSALIFQLDPFWSATYRTQNLMPAPPPWSLPIDLGIVLLAAPAAWWTVRTWPAERRRLLLLWVALAFAWLYLPVPYQRRFAFGVQPALAVLASVGLLAINHWMRERAWGPVRRRAVNYTVAFAALMGVVFTAASLLASAARNTPFEVYVWSKSEVEASQWLAAHSGPNDVVLTATKFAIPLAGVIHGRVVHAHPVATLDYTEKEALVKRFYSADASTTERSALLRQTGATIVALGPRERALGVHDLDAQPDLELLYAQDDVRWYQVREAGG